jgi:catechol 2,3-dioxygenase
MMIQLKRLGHILLRVADVEQSKAFYSGLLGFEIVEEDPNHGGVFMTLGEHGHTLDVMPADGPAPVRLSPQQVGMQHFAFQVDSFEALKDAYFTLQDNGVEVMRAIDHVSQKSIYFADPDGNTVEVYYELPQALAMFREGREDRDEPFTFER